MSKLTVIQNSWNQIAGEYFQKKGFKPYGKDGYGRLTHDNVFQFFLFNIHRNNTTFTIDVGIRPLYCENETYLTLYPGNRLGRIALKPAMDRWWSCENDEACNQSVADILQLMQQFVLPFYDSTRSADDIIKSNRKNIFGMNKFGDRIRWATRGNECFDFGYIFLRAGDTRKAIIEFEKCLRTLQSSSLERELRKVPYFESLITLCRSGEQQINRFLEDRIATSLTNLNLKNWLKADINARIFHQYQSIQEKKEVERLLQSLSGMDLTVGADQLARAVLVQSDGNISELKRIFDSNFNGDPRDLIMAAVAKTKNKSYFSEPMEY